MGREVRIDRGGLTYDKLFEFGGAERGDMDVGFDVEGGFVGLFFEIFEVGGEDERWSHGERKREESNVEEEKGEGFGDECLGVGKLLG